MALAIQSIYDQAPTPAGWELVDRLFAPEDPQPTALILRDTETGNLAMPVRGSWTGWDWEQDFRFLFTSSPWGVGLVERGFLDYFQSSKTESGKPLPAIAWFAGHSLGGPAATFFSLCMAPGTAELLVVETPEPGDHAFCAWASPRLAAVHRWENPEDVVPDAPGRFLGYADLEVPPTVIDMRPLNPPAFNPLDPVDSLKRKLEFNHSIQNCVAAFQLQNP